MIKLSKAVGAFRKETWFENWEKEEKKEFIIRGILLDLVSMEGILEEDIICMAKQLLENRGYFFISKRQLRGRLLQLTDQYGYVRKEEDRFSLSETGKAVLESPLTDERLADNYINHLIMKVNFLYQ